MQKKLLACQILRRKCNGMISSSTRKLLFWQRHKDKPQRAFRRKRFWVRNLSVRHSVERVRIRSYGPHFSLIFPHSDWIRRDIPYLSVFSRNVGKHGPEKLRIRTPLNTVKIRSPELHNKDRFCYFTKRDMSITRTWLLGNKSFHSFTYFKYYDTLPT